MAEAESFGKIIALPFPGVPLNFSTEEVQQMVFEKLQEILKLSPAAVLCQGEFIYTVAMLEELKKTKPRQWRQPVKESFLKLQRRTAQPRSF